MEFIEHDVIQHFHIVFISFHISVLLFWHCMSHVCHIVVLFLAGWSKSCRNEASKRSVSRHATSTARDETKKYVRKQKYKLQALPSLSAIGS